MPGLKHAVSMTPLRLVDIMPTFLNALGIKPTEPMDGTAYSLNLPRSDHKGICLGMTARRRPGRMAPRPRSLW